jgi:hypothetical protein
MRTNIVIDIIEISFDNSVKFLHIWIMDRIVTYWPPPTLILKQGTLHVDSLTNIIKIRSSI